MAGNDWRRAALGEIFTRNFLVLATINLCMFFGFQMLNVGLPLYLAQLGASARLVGLATTLMTITATLVRVFAGALLDRFGRRGMLVGGLVIMVCSIVSFAVFPFVGIILGLRLLHGVGWGTGSTAASTMAADIIPKHRFAEGMGYFSLTTALSSAIAPAVAVAIAQGAGAVFMVYVAAGITVLALVLAVAEALCGKRAAAEAPGFPEADGAATHQGPEAGGRPDRESGHGPGAPRPRSLLETFFERRALLPGLLILLVNIGFGCITTFIALHADAQGVNGVTAYFIVYAVVTLVSRPYIGTLIDRFGYRVPAILSALCTAATLVLIGMASNIWMFAGGGVLGGLGIGTAMSTFQSMAVASVEPWRRGVATSTYMTAFDLGIAIGSLLGGFVVDAHGYAVMYFAMALSPLAASVLSFAVVKKGPDRRDA
ncbi:MAG TPA: hypothetical protein DCP91_13420 [Eggerthellaceae bacterium]|nr:hypothetical protein [Eggerthellaceae bacterium]